MCNLVYILKDPLWVLCEKRFGVGGRLRTEAVGPINRLLQWSKWAMMVAQPMVMVASIVRSVQILDSTESMMVWRGQVGMGDHTGGGFGHCLLGGESRGWV